MHPGTRALPMAALATGAALLAAAALNVSQGQSDPQTGSPLKVAEALDCFVQPRFAKVDGKFGLTRLVPIAPPGHPAANMLYANEQEERYLRIADSAHRPYVVAFLHFEHPPASRDDTVNGTDRGIRSADMQRGRALSAEASPYLTTLVENMADHWHPPRRFRHKQTPREKAAALAHLARTNRVEQAAKRVRNLGIAAVPRLKRGEAVDTACGDWFVAMRPVRASSRICLSCHTTAKQGDPLGAMVYIVSKKTTDNKTTRRPL